MLNELSSSVKISTIELLVLYLFYFIDIFLHIRILIAGNDTIETLYLALMITLREQLKYL
jgi:hypothetical protein